MKIDVGVAQAQGPRPSMEDAHCLLPGFGGKGGAFFAGVFDGHGGADASAIAAQDIPKRFLEALAGGSPIEQAFISAYSQIAQEIKKVTRSGTTAATLYLEGGQLHYAHVGDSRIVLAAQEMAVPLTRDHKVTDDTERAQLQARGGKFWESYVVLPSGMGLAVSRALGDRDFERLVTPEPEVGTRPLTPQDRLLIIGCDGLWDVLKNQQAVDIALSYPNAQAAADALVRAALVAGTGDNLTVVVLLLNQG